MQKILTFLIWLVGLWAIALFCGRGTSPPVAMPGAPAMPAAPRAEAPAATPPAAPAPTPAPPAPSPAAIAATQKIDDVLKSKVVEFATGSAALTAVGQATLTQISPIFKDNPGLKVEVQGHTDDSGPAEANQTLSQARANAVKAMLVLQGVAAERISAKGYGASRPVADNTTAECRTRNRRIVFSVEESK